MFTFIYQSTNLSQSLEKDIIHGHFAFNFALVPQREGAGEGNQGAGPEPTTRM